MTMKATFQVGDEKTYRYRVQPEDVAAFHGEVVHSVCATFVLAREIEWTSRLFVLALRDDEEEGVGTFLSIDHKTPAFVGEEVIFTAKIEKLQGHELICAYQAHVDGRLIAEGKTGQKILKKELIKKIFGTADRNQ
jgi:fluoroacetyl-CoA thioesterase